MPKLSWETPVYMREQGFDMNISYDSSKRTEYVGIAPPGSADTSAVWSIYKLTYDVTSGGVATRRYANNSDGFEFVWGNRATYSY